MRAEWATYVAQVIVGDEVCYFRSPTRPLDGRAGFAIVRGGRDLPVIRTSSLLCTRRSAIADAAALLLKRALQSLKGKLLVTTVVERW